MRGYFAPRSGILRFSGETAEAHPGFSEVCFGLVPGRAVQGGVGQSARVAHAGAAWSEGEGKTLERRRKLRRGSAVCIGCNSPAAVRIRCRSKALEAKKARDHRLFVGFAEKRAPEHCGVYCAVRRRNARRVIQPVTSWLDLTTRENPWRVKPHGRYRHETGPGVRARRKPSRG
jgi:hypothetical protein